MAAKAKRTGWAPRASRTCIREPLTTRQENVIGEWQVEGFDLWSLARTLEALLADMDTGSTARPVDPSDVTAAYRTARALTERLRNLAGAMDTVQLRQFFPDAEGAR